MFWPLGETGVGKIGLKPPTPHALNKKAAATEPAIVRSTRTREVTMLKYIGDRNCAPPRRSTATG